MLLHPMMDLVTVSPPSGVGMVEEAGCGSIVGACACHPRQVLTVLAQIDSSTMTTTTKTRCQCTLSIHSTQKACSSGQNSSPHSRVKLKCKLGGPPRWRHLRTGQAMLPPQHVLLVRPGRADYRPSTGSTICFQIFEGGCNLLTTSKPSETSIDRLPRAPPKAAVVEIDTSRRARLYVDFEVGFGKARQRCVVR